MRPVGYYIHHQGAGHRQRGSMVAARLRRPCTLIGTVNAATVGEAPGPVLRLPDDRLDASFSGQDGTASRPLTLHYAPLDHPGVRNRMAAIARWVDEVEPALLVVDVSVEVALLARLLSVPTLVVRLAGHRTDPAHLEAFRSAEMLIAPFPEMLEAPETPAWVRNKTLYAGLLGPAAALSADRDDGEDILVVLGRGGERRDVADLVAAARAVPSRTWHVLGEVQGVPSADAPPNLRLHGWVEDPAAHLASAVILVGAGGDGVVGLASSQAKRFVCLPEVRAYGEQVVKARALAGCGAAIVREAWPADWPTVIDEAAALDPAAIASLSRPDGYGWLAGQIEEMAARLDARRSKGSIVR